MTPQDAIKHLSPAQLTSLAQCKAGAPVPLDLLVLDPPLVRGDGSRTPFGNEVIALHVAQSPALPLKEGGEAPTSIPSMDERWGR